MSIAPIVIDGREMQPPEPLERTLAALDELQAGQEILLLLYCEPHPLYSILRRNGYLWATELQADGTSEIRIRCP
jgi:uncharacterized protein (DUF2249 family)